MMYFWDESVDICYYKMNNRSDRFFISLKSHIIADSAYAYHDVLPIHLSNSKVHPQALLRQDSIVDLLMQWAKVLLKKSETRSRSQPRRHQRVSLTSKPNRSEDPFKCVCVECLNHFIVKRETKSINGLSGVNNHTILWFIDQKFWNMTHAKSQQQCMRVVEYGSTHWNLCAEKNIVFTSLPF